MSEVADDDDTPDAWEVADVALLHQLAKDTP
jgi:hypothetical protein